MASPTNHSISVLTHIDPITVTFLFPPKWLQNETKSFRLKICLHDHANSALNIFNSTPERTSTLKIKTFAKNMFDYIYLGKNFNKKLNYRRIDIFPLPLWCITQTMVPSNIYKNMLTMYMPVLYC